MENVDPKYSVIFSSDKPLLNNFEAIFTGLIPVRIPHGFITVIRKDTDFPLSLYLLLLKSRDPDTL